MFECHLPYPALPLTVDNVFEAVKTVRLSWSQLAWELGLYKLRAIKRQHDSDEAHLRAVVAAFLLGEGMYQPSWRMLIHRLHKADKGHLIEKIKTNAEPHQGEWMSSCMQCRVGRITLFTYHSGKPSRESLAIFMNFTV